jgi:hypothetical protein
MASFAPRAHPLAGGRVLLRREVGGFFVRVAVAVPCAFVPACASGSSAYLVRVPAEQADCADTCNAQGAANAQTVGACYAKCPGAETRPDAACDATEQRCVTVRKSTKDNSEVVLGLLLLLGLVGLTVLVIEGTSFGLKGGFGGGD